MKNILLSLDFNGGETILVDKTLEISKKFNSKVWLIHVASPDPDYVGFDVGPQSVRDNRANQLREEHQKLQDFVNELTREGILCEALLIQGSTVETILKKAEKLNIDLIVIGHEIHGIIYKALFGSVSEGLIKKTNIPVLVVPLD